MTTINVQFLENNSYFSRESTIVNEALEDDYSDLVDNIKTRSVLHELEKNFDGNKLYKYFFKIK